jgi:hypothetical protein
MKWASGQVLEMPIGDSHHVDIIARGIMSFEFLDFNHNFRSINDDIDLLTC